MYSKIRKAWRLRLPSFVSYAFAFPPNSNDSFLGSYDGHGLLPLSGCSWLWYYRILWARYWIQWPSRKLIKWVIGTTIGPSSDHWDANLCACCWCAVPVIDVLVFGVTCCLFACCWYGSVLMCLLPLLLLTPLTLNWAFVAIVFQSPMFADDRKNGTRIGSLIDTLPKGLIEATNQVLIYAI